MVSIGDLLPKPKYSGTGVSYAISGSSPTGQTGSNRQETTDRTALNEGSGALAVRPPLTITEDAPGTSSALKPITDASAIVPLYARPGADLSLARPDTEEVERTRERTQAALDAVLAERARKAVASDALATAARGPVAPQLVEYVPASVTGDAPARTLKIVEVQRDPLDPSRARHIKAPPRPPSPPAPILRAPPAPITKEERAKWAIPRAISAWKNPLGKVVSVEERVAAHSGGSTDSELAVAEPTARLVALNDALQMAETQAREDVRARAEAREAAEQAAVDARAARIQLLAEEARRAEEAARVGRGRNRAERGHAGGAAHVSRSRSPGAARRSENRAVRRREAADEYDAQRRAARRNEPLRHVVDARGVGAAGTDAAPAEAQFDSRLFARAKTPSREVYDEPLFAAQQVLREIFVPRVDDEAGSAAGAANDGALQARARLGPVEFEKDA